MVLAIVIIYPILVEIVLLLVGKYNGIQFLEKAISQTKMAKIDFKIMASPKRRKRAEELCAELELPETSIIYDDRPEGGEAIYTSKKTWCAPLENSATHRCVIQDDIILCDNFKELLLKIVTHHPKTAITGIYFSTPISYPNRKGTPYYLVPFLSGCMICLPRKDIIPCMEWCDSICDKNIGEHDDLSITDYCKKNGILTICPFPNIVQHIDEESLLSTVYNHKRVSKNFSKNPNADWENKSIYNFY